MRVSSHTRFSRVSSLQPFVCWCCSFVCSVHVLPTKKIDGNLRNEPINKPSSVFLSGVTCRVLIWDQRSDGRPGSAVGFNKGSCLILRITIIGENATQRSGGCSRRRGRDVKGGLPPASTVSLQTRGSRRFYSIVFLSSNFHFPFAARPVSPFPPFCFFCQKTALVSKSLLISNLSFLLKNSSAAAARRPETDWLQISRQIFQLPPSNCSRFSVSDFLQAASRPADGGAKLRLCGTISRSFTQNSNCCESSSE